MPFPADLESLQSAGYVYSHWKVCSECGEGVEVWKTPGKREIAMQPMIEALRPAIRHYMVCAPKQEEQSGAVGNIQDIAGRDSDNRDGVSTASRQEVHVYATRDGELRGGLLHNGGHDAQGSGIKLYGVRDKNMMAVGWQDGTLKVAFRFGTYLYANVAEDAYLKIKKNPYPNALFVKLVKNHPELYPCTKVA